MTGGHAGTTGPGTPRPGSGLLRAVSAFVRGVEGVAAVAALAAAATLFCIGFLIGVEVGLRAMGHPTKWTAEIAQIAQIWCVFLAGAYVLSKRDMITVDLLPFTPGRPLWRLVEAVALLAIAGFCLLMVKQGLNDAARSIKLGTATDTALSLPMWTIQLALPIGLGLLFLQCCAELLKLWVLPAPATPET